MWQERFYSLLAAPSDGDEDRAFELKSANLPSKVYTYRAPDGYALEGLRDSTVWLSAAARFNDPYDSSLFMDSLGALRYQVRKILLEDPPRGLTPADIQIIAHATDPLQAATDLLRGPQSDLTYEEALQLQRLLLGNARTHSLEMSGRFSALVQQAVKVCSFSTTLDSLVMWAHYADSHRGFCVEYSLESLPNAHPARQNIFPVRYSDIRYDLTRDFELFLESAHAEESNHPLLAALNKSTHWSYENEWRLVMFDDSEKAGGRISMPIPSAVYLGSRMPREYRAEIVEAAQLKNIPLFEMGLAPNTFALKPTPIRD
jgi:hypothetical protein